ncbi:MAG: hypothetical protein JRN20_05105 [Nitrososphaerota archaeon]|nr:hypothetical protein [Nitrososphaerota archaeon]MDG6922469.1 hypothetical protein [Nitrososphaerota archaeon]
MRQNPWSPFQWSRRSPVEQVKVVNTYDYVWIILALLISLLWFRINSTPVFPPGLVGGLAISYMVPNIDVSLGKQFYLKLSIVLCVIACIIGIVFNG